jgi:hypothetical protein
MNFCSLVRVVALSSSLVGLNLAAPQMGASSLWIAPVQAQEAAPISTITPINVAEAIIEPFWDPQISELDKWKLTASPANGVKVEKGWSNAEISWASAPTTGPVVTLERKLDVDVSNYDKLLLSIIFPSSTKLRLTAQTDVGERAAEFTRLPNELLEYALDLGGAKRLAGVKIELLASEPGIGAASSAWLGLQNSQQLPLVLHQYKGYSDKWPRHLKPVDFVPKFAPTYNILMSPEELTELRSLHKKMVAKNGKDIFTEAAEFVRKYPPEAMINEFNNTNDSRFARDRDRFRILAQTGVSAAVAGLVMEDPELMRLAARYALSTATSTYWDDGFRSYFPGGQWEPRPFIPSFHAHDVAMLLDLTGEMFTDGGRDFLMRRLGEHGLGTLNYAYWKWEYIYKTNQAAVFAPARILSYSILEKSWPRVAPYNDLALKDLQENVSNTVQVDGSYLEGPLYFGTIGRHATLSHYYYARARGKELSDILPARIRLTGDFAEVVSSTTPEADFIPYGDSANVVFENFTKAMMAYALPDSAWGRILGKTVQRDGGDAEIWPLGRPFSPGVHTSLSDEVLAWKLARTWRQSKKSPAPKPFVNLPEAGMMSSTREFDGEWIKLLIYGAHANAIHLHEDQGSFVMEAGGETFAMDPQIFSYSDPDSALLKQAQRHNMLVPVGTAERPSSPQVLPVPVKPTGKGTAEAFQATINPTPIWTKFYNNWQRSWNSPTPDDLTITDDYELAQGTGVEFYWNTDRTVTQEKGKIVLTGKRARVTITPPAGTTVRIDEISRAGDKRFAPTYKRIAIVKPGTSGQLVTHVRTEILPDAP